MRSSRGARRPFAVLGPHVSRNGSVTVRAFLPGARAAVVSGSDGGALQAIRSSPIHPDGLWEGERPAGRTALAALAYRLRVTDAPGARPRSRTPTASRPA